MTPLDVGARVTALVARIDEAWRRADGVAASFPKIACESLRTVTVFETERCEEVFAALLSSRSTAPPTDGRRADSIMLFNGPRFSIRVRISAGELGKMRSAGAGGALQILTGPALYATASFAVATEYDSQFALGTLTHHSFDVRETGTAIAFAPDTIHAVSVLARAGAWLVIETNESLGAGALDFSLPGVRVGLDVDHATDHRLKCFGILYQIDPSRYAALLESALRDADPRTCFLLLRHAIAAFPKLEASRLFDAAGPRFGAHGERVCAALDRLARSRALQHLTRHLEPPERLLVAALERATDGCDLDALLAQGTLGAAAAAVVELARRNGAVSPFASILAAL